ncbi:MAG: PilZ domain-containing protein [Methylococcaceae bacterium]|nr:PilZ domain-containing protein [Methylococcaceae bacterium]
MQKGFAANERRHFHRIAYDAPAWLSDGEKTWPVHLIDLSLHGCLLKFPADRIAQPGTDYKLTVQLGDSIAIRMNLALVRDAPERTGFECTHIDLDSICELRRLLELNLGDASLLERDLNALTGA